MFSTYVLIAGLVLGAVALVATVVGAIKLFSEHAAAGAASLLLGLIVLAALGGVLVFQQDMSNLRDQLAGVPELSIPQP